MQECILLKVETVFKKDLPWNSSAAQCINIPKKYKETSNLMWLSMIWFISVLFVCWNLFCTKTNLRIKCVTETKNVSRYFVLQKCWIKLFYMTRTFDSKVFLHSWLLWPTVCCAVVQTNFNATFQKYRSHCEKGKGFG